MLTRISCFFCVIFLSFGAFGQALFPVKDTVTNLYGYKSAINSKWLIKPNYERVERFSEGYAIVSVKGLLGLINQKGTYVITPMYERLEGERYLTFKSKDTIGIIHSSGKVLLSGAYTHIYYESSRGSAIIMDKNFYGYWDTLGNFVPPISNYELAFEKDMAYFNSGKEQGFINKQGKKLIQVEDGNLWDVSSFGYIGQRNGKECVFDTNGNKIREFDSIQIIQMRKHLILYVKDQQYRIMNYKGEDISGNEYDYISPFNEKGISIVKKNEQYGLIDEELQVILPLENEHIDEYGSGYNRFFGKYEKSSSYSVFKKGEHFGVVNDSGRVILEPQYDMVGIDQEYKLKYIYKDSTLGLLDLRNLKKLPLIVSFHFVNNKTVFCLENNGTKCGIANKQGKVLVMPVYKEIVPMINGYSIVKDQYGAGILDTSGKVIVPLVYGSIKTLNDVYNEKYQHRGDVAWDGFLYVKTKDNKSGVATETGKLLIDTTYKNTTIFDEECKCWFVCDKKNRWRIINLAGKKRSSKLSSPAVFMEGVAVAHKNHKSGIINVEGKNIVPFEYSAIDRQEAGVYYFQKDSTWGVLNKSGKVIIEPIFKTKAPFINQHAFAREKIFWNIIDTLGEIKTLENVKALQDSSYAKTVNNSRVISFSYNTLNGYDEVSFDLVVDHPFGPFINNFILNSKEDVFNKGEKIQEILLMTDTSTAADVSGGDYRGVGMELLTITKNTFTINEFTEESKDGVNEVKEEYRSYFVNGDSLVEISLEEMFNSPDYLNVLNKSAIARLRKIGLEVVADTLIFYPINFRISDKGLIFEGNKNIVPDIEALESSDILILYEEIREIVKKDGSLKEFYE